jgi:hypothetical protein
LLRDVQTGNWYDDLAVPPTFTGEGGAKRGVQDLNNSLHDVERKRVLANAVSLADVTVGAGNNYVILSLAQLPANTTAAVGAVTTLGTVVAAHGGTFGTHALSEVSGATAISPKNLCGIVDGATRDPILSSGRVIYALLQTETATDGHTMTGTTPVRAQLSFVRINAAGDDLEAVSVADIENKTINYVSVTRKALEDLTEQDFLRGAEVDVPASATVTRQVAYDNQGTTPVDLTTNATLDLEGAGLAWRIRDDTEANLFGVVEGSAGGTSEVQVNAAVDVFNVDAAVNDFAEGIRVDSGGQRINLGETAGLIESTSGNDLRVLGAGELLLDDGNQTGSTWAQTAGIKLSDSTQEWDDFEAKFGEVSLLRAIYQAGSDENPATFHVVTVNTSADSDVSLVAGNLDIALPDLSNGTFTLNHRLYLNGQRLRPGANAAANFDYYPGSTLTPAAALRFEFNVKAGDVICIERIDL